MISATIQATLDEIGFDLAAVGASAVGAAVSRRAACMGVVEGSYADLLSHSPAERLRLLDELVVGETWFFRDGAALHSLCAHLNDQSKQRPQRRFKILSAPCATGEEAYSTAIALLEAGTSPGSFHVDAADVCEKFLKSARNAQYTSRSFRGRSFDRWRRYFDVEGAVRSPIDCARRKVDFVHANLMTPHALEARGPYDYILCRNLLIYMTVEGRQAVFTNLHRLLRPEGILYVGPAEGRLASSSGFGGAGDPAAFAFTARPDRVAPATPRPSPRRPQVAPKRPGPALNEAPTRLRQDLLAQARRLADRGRARPAVELCLKHLEQSGHDCEAFVLLGILHSSLGEDAEAESYFQRVLYLDPAHEEALEHMALLVEQRGDKASAKRLRRRAAGVRGNR